MAVNQQSNKPFCVSSFNCEGFNEQKQLFIKELLTQTDILFLQEFWVIDSTLHKLQMLSDNFLCSARCRTRENPLRSSIWWCGGYVEQEFKS